MSKKDRERAEWVWNALDVYPTMDDAQLRYALAWALTRIPEEIGGRLTEECLFIRVTHQAEGEYVPATFVHGRSLIVCASDFDEKPMQEQIRTLMHECAHHILSHGCPMEWAGEPDLTERYEAQEAEAWQLVQTWLDSTEPWDDLPGEGHAT